MIWKKGGMLPRKTMKFLEKTIEKLRKFMMGRYGGDQLNRFILMAALVLLFISALFQVGGWWIAGVVLNVFELFLVLLALYRALSKKIYVRMAENNKFLKIKGGFVGFFKLRRAMFRDRKTHVFKKCPNCKSILRLPRKKGHHTVKCIRCAHRFDVDVR